MPISPQLVKRFAANPKGNDYVVGDIHGHFDKLRELMDHVRFNTNTDRLFSVGDLVDRGPKSHEVLRWLAEPWFHPVMGNHEATTLNYLHQFNCEFPPRFRHDDGYEWVGLMSPRDITNMFRVFNMLPAAMEVKIRGAKVGIIHADILHPSWAMFLSDLVLGGYHGDVFDRTMWKFHRYKYKIEIPVLEVRNVYVGHVIVKNPVTLGNVVYIDTGCYKTGRMTLVNIKTNQTVTL